MEKDINLFRFNIDRGGTFTDIFCEYDKDKTVTYKLLSVDPQNYEDAPAEGIRRIISKYANIEIKKGEKIPSQYIESVRMGTTIATNALLERKGERCALLITEGFKDLMEIGNQSRASIFDLNIKRPEKLYEKVFEVRERVRILKEQPLNDKYKTFKQGTTGEYVEILNPLKDEEITQYLNEIKSLDIKSIAVAFVHSYTFREHEYKIKEIINQTPEFKSHFTNISLSSEIMPFVKFYPRGSTSVVDAYLTPAIYKYVNKFLSYFSDPEKMNVLFMQSDGGLTKHDKFFGSKAIISGPAGGVVGYSKTTAEEIPNMPIIGLDMGGTSTDVSRYHNGWDHVFEIQISGVAINSPMIDVNTVAAGGGSQLFFKNGMFTVGPESAGAEPGPLCYLKHGYLAVTDANLVLQRLIPKYFPKIFGKNADEPLSYEESYKGMLDMMKYIIEETKSDPTFMKNFTTVEEVANGFIKVANEAMCRPIRSLTQARGYDPKEHILSIFGGAGGQHACALARLLNMPKVYIHKYAGILSAYGLSLADLVEELQEPINRTLNEESLGFCKSMFKNMESKCKMGLKEMESSSLKYNTERYLLLRYEGNDYNLSVKEGEDNYKVYERNFEEAFKREYGFLLEKRSIIIDYARVRVALVSTKEDTLSDTNVGDNSEILNPTPDDTTQTYFEVNNKVVKLDTKVYQWDGLKPNTTLDGPVIILSGNSTILVEPGCVARITKLGNLIIDISNNKSEDTQNSKSEDIPNDPLELSLFANRFMSIAEQMGRHLQRTAVSTNIKERLDFSCALFDSDGNLVANAPHQPVHLGAMQEIVKHQKRYLNEGWKKGEVILSNHPMAGGSHLPDMTVVTPVYIQDELVFYVGNRGHHADIGGITPGSMPPNSRTLFEEGAAIYSLKMIENGEFQHEKLVKILRDDLIENGVSGSRNLDDNISDLQAQAAANNEGVTLLQELISKHGLHRVKVYMKYIQQAAEESVRKMLDKFGQSIGIVEQASGFVYEEDYMDDGSKICLKVTINRSTRSAEFDFTNTSPMVYGNINAPKAVTMSAIIYSLRAMIDDVIPLNQGCLNPVKVIIPDNTLLSPSETCAVVGGNVTTSQRVTDIILKAFKACAASQGDCNNLTFGNEKLGYYETIGGGSGAGPGFHGMSGTQVHMTNTRITDVEIIERRYPVLVENYSFREDSGGKGKWNGGNGIIRAFRFFDNLDVSILSERRVFAPFGLFGGEDAKKGVNLYVTKKGLVFNIGSKATVKVEVGDQVVIMTPGGGGYGKHEQEGEKNEDENKTIVKTTKEVFNIGSLYRYFYDQYSN